MSLKILDLDDRRYAAIVEDARKRISIYTKEWSDHNIHDPGVTFLELLSWIAEMQIYHLDQITERHYLKYLKLLGFSPRVQRCASVDLTLNLSDADGELVIPQGKRIVTYDEAGLELVFEASRMVAITHATIKKIISDYSTWRDDNTEANNTPGVYFLAFGPEAKKGSCMYTGFDVSPFSYSVEALDLVIRFYEENLSPVASHGDEKSDVRVSVKVAWQYCTDYERWHDEDAWEDFEIEEDTTRMMSREGVVVLKTPQNRPTKGKIFDHEEEYFWIRCKTIGDKYEIPPQIESVSINTVKAVHRATVVDEPLVRVDDLDFPDESTSSGLPNQRFSFKNTQIIGAEIFIEELEWKEVADFSGSGPEDMHYMLNRTGGEITFGDGIRGKTPEVGQKVKVRRYSYGGGERGNVTLNSTWKFSDEGFNGVTVTNFHKATGGEKEESVKSALSRLKIDIKVPYRAVTLKDYQYIATHTPGLRFGRAKAIVRTDEEMVEGCEKFSRVKIVVVPYSTLDRAEPSQGFIDTVCHHIDRHRLLTDSIEVRGPKYVGIGVRSHVGIKPGYSEEGRMAEIEEVLKNFLHPLKGGEGRRGWPFGRTVYRSEIYEVIELVEGVDCVRSVSLEATGDAGGMDAKGNVVIDKDALVYSTGHRIRTMEREGRCSGGG